MSKNRISKDKVFASILSGNLGRKKTKKFLYPPSSVYEEKLTQVQKSLFIESLFLDLVTESIIAVEARDGISYIFKGYGFCKAIKEFFDNDYKLTGLEISTDLNGLKYETLLPLYQSRLEDRLIEIIKIQPPTDKNTILSILKMNNIHINKVDLLFIGKKN